MFHIFGTIFSFLGKIKKNRPGGGGGGVMSSHDDCWSWVHVLQKQSLMFNTNYQYQISFFKCQPQGQVKQLSITLTGTKLKWYDCIKHLGCHKLNGYLNLHWHILSASLKCYGCNFYGSLLTIILTDICI